MNGATNKHIDGSAVDEKIFKFVKLAYVLIRKMLQNCPEKRAEVERPKLAEAIVEKKNE